MDGDNKTYLQKITEMMAKNHFADVSKKLLRGVETPLFSNLCIRDKRTDFEKAFDKEKAHVKNEYWKRLKGIFFGLKKKYHN